MLAKLKEIVLSKTAPENKKDGSAEFSSLLKQAQQGDAKAQCEVGFRYQEGEGVSKDCKEAVKWFEMAASQKYPLGYFWLGISYFYGQEVAKDLAKAEELFMQAMPGLKKMAIELNDASSQLALGYCYQEGWGGIQKNESQAFTWFQKAAAQGIALAQYSLGSCYQNGRGTKQDYAQAFAWYQKAAQQGNARMQATLGWCYINGRGVKQDDGQAFALYQKAAQQENAEAQNGLGWCYENGRGVKQDYTQAVAWYQKAAQQGNVGAQNGLGLCYETGRGIKQDYVLAVHWYEIAAQQGNADAQKNLGNCYFNGKGVKQDDGQAFACYQKAATQGNAHGQYNLGLCYESGRGVTQDYTLAADYYQKAAQQWHVDAQLHLGHCYVNGRGVKQDYAQAFDCYQKAAHQGNAEAQNNLGICYENGWGVKQDYAQAVIWYQKGAEQGNADAQFSLGRRYENGLGVKQDYAQAVTLYQKAAQQGNADAQNNLGRCHELGWGVKQDYGKAVGWYQKGAEQGNAYAQTNLGRCYENGLGVKQDYAQAFAWYQKATQQGNAGAQHKLGRCYENGWGVKQDFAQAFACYQNAAQQGIADAQNDLGRCYEFGWGVKQDYGKAMGWYQKAAAQHNYAAKQYLEALQKQGHQAVSVEAELDAVPIALVPPAANLEAKQGAMAESSYLPFTPQYPIITPATLAPVLPSLDKKDEAMPSKIALENKEQRSAEFTSLLQQAQQGDAKAQCEVGLRYKEGEGVSKDYEEAVKWFVMAASQKYPLGYYRLAVSYFYGQGVAKDLTKAEELFKQAVPGLQKMAIEQNDAASQRGLGYCYQEGWGLKKDDSQAFAWFQKAAGQGNAAAQTNLGHCYLSGQGVKKDYALAVDWYQKAAQQGNDDAQNNLGRCYENGWGVKKDYVLAVDWYQKAAQQGHDYAQNNVGRCYQNGKGVKQDYAQAFAWYKKGAEQGNALAQKNLGLCYKNGLGVKQDDAQAFAWYQRAAKQGDAFALNQLGWLYEFGQGVKQDYAQAIACYQETAQQGDAVGQASLGLCYENGRGVKQDYGEAVARYRIAAQQGDTLAQAWAQGRLGRCYENGWGVEQDYAQAFAWYQKGAQQGDADAQTNLGRCYENGRGAQQDHGKAMGWYQKATTQGNNEAKQCLEALQKQGHQAVSVEVDAAPITPVPLASNLEAKQDSVTVSPLPQLGKKDEKPSASLPLSPDTFQAQLKLAKAGNAKAQVYIGERYLYDHEGMTQDPAEAVMWFQTAASQNDAEGQYHLGYCCETGQGVAQNEAEAIGWYQKAAAQGNSIAKTRLDALQKQNRGENADKKDEMPHPAAIAVPRIAWKELTVGDLVGNGGYGDVYRGKWFGKDVAIKQLQLKTLSKPSAKVFVQEAELMWQCDSPHIVGLRGVCMEAGHFAMIMEYMPKGSLRQQLQGENELSWEKRWQLAVDIAEGLKYLHGRGILHRDLKSFNILLDANERAKIADFGLAKIKLEINTSTTKSNKATGSVRWRAPELFKRNATPTTASDIYSLGMILWEIVSQQLPFSDATDEITAMGWIKDGEQEKIPENCPKPLADIIQTCWAAPDKRPSADEVVTRLKRAQLEFLSAKESKSQQKEGSPQVDYVTKPSAPDAEDESVIPGMPGQPLAIAPDAALSAQMPVTDFFAHKGKNGNPQITVQKQAVANTTLLEAPEAP